MASNLKLEIFRISLKKKNGRNNALYNYKELFDLIDKNKETAYNAFVAKFIAYFDNEFKMNADGNKGISSSANNKYEPKFTQNIINGEVNVNEMITESDTFELPKDSLEKCQAILKIYKEKLHWIEEDK